jgi:hypothetical protein
VEGAEATASLSEAAASPPEAAGCPEEAARTGAEGVASLSELLCGSGNLLFSFFFGFFFTIYNHAVTVSVHFIKKKREKIVKVICVVIIFKLMRVQ